MKLATLACLALLGLVGSTVPSPAQAPAPGAKNAGQPQATAPAARPPAAQPQAAPSAAVGRAGQAGTRAERRRRSYAACNRASHQRGLSGGRRRRFLIRCRLGYERPRQPPATQAAPPAPAQQPAQGARP
ncbi:hypothetical protein [Methylobacterium dankookense]|uniref:Serine/threonine protein kinase n=1 Tax=Methylobacterium dankookense TaxID=560405 RepID=A0ABQ4RRN0_9HYPH|nr:hypothetical protein [Methylobacterium dankookense]GJD59406.1 hypothetical protein IFDJLNFL_5334 [Methylobacterium dankookense]